MKSILLFTATVFAASSSECPIAKSTTSNIFAGWWGNGNFKQAQVLNALYQLQDIVTHDCNRKVFYVYGDGVIVGAWFGKWVHPQGAYQLVSAYINDAAQYGVPGGKAVEYCGNEQDKAGYRMGITIDTNSNIAGVKQTVESWSKGECVTQWGDGRITWANQLLHFYSSVPKNEFSESITPMPYNGRAAMYEVKTPSNVERRKYIDSNFYCTGVKDDENAAYYDVQLEGNLSASAMKFCREWCNNKQSSHNKRQECSKPY